jgi:hypothetical protein
MVDLGDGTYCAHETVRNTTGAVLTRAAHAPAAITQNGNGVSLNFTKPKF